MWGPAAQTQAGAAAFVTEPGAAMSYLTNVQWKLSERSFLFVVRADGTAFFVCPGTSRPSTQGG
jgi:Xaa-Pro aminopeptidase